MTKTEPILHEGIKVGECTWVDRISLADAATLVGTYAPFTPAWRVIPASTAPSPCTVVLNIEIFADYRKMGHARKFLMNLLVEQDTIGTKSIFISRGSFFDPSKEDWLYAFYSSLGFKQLEDSVIMLRVSSILI